MDSLQLAERRLDSNLPRADKPSYEYPRAKLQACIRNDVCPALEEYSQRLRFQEYANWPFITLMSGADTPERRLIESLEQGILRCAKSLSQLTEKKLVRKKLEEQNPPRLTVMEGTIEITAEDTTYLDKKNGNFNELEMILSQVDHLAQNTDLSLVNSSDYFDPVQEFSEDADGKRVQHGGLIIAFNHELDPVGNFIVRCFLERARQWYEIVSKLRAITIKATRATGRPYRQLVDQLENEWKKLETDWLECKHLLKSGKQNRLINSAVILTQVYAAFGLKPQLDWLLLPETDLNYGIESIKSRLNALLDQETTDRIAHALGDMKDLYENDEQHNDDIEEAIVTGGLVLIKKSREAYWENRKISGPIKGRKWEFLHLLAKKAKRRNCVTENDLFPLGSGSLSAMATSWSRLNERLPESLWKLVEKGAEPRTYILRLDPTQIHIF
ncbi:hypothetical protein [Gimesia fumaroli]|uniref:Uncharacterized protein n=1 Tax=Gimesia fumaroli TaxID=2527976 RepID=A0A518IGE4_9PLAN|nr:hypothetical protein [Gimesia fumaroli]QDV52162.1 hypothetical protein Enr17x_42220 [Gimesia fumaroli]